MAKDKIELDWKAPSEKVMVDFVESLGDDIMKEFFAECVVKDEAKGGFKINRPKAKRWLDEKYSDSIIWKGKPAKARGVSVAEKLKYMSQL